MHIAGLMDIPPNGVIDSLGAYTDPRTFGISIPEQSPKSKKTTRDGGLSA